MNFVLNRLTAYFCCDIMNSSKTEINELIERIEIYGFNERIYKKCKCYFSVHYQIIFGGL